MALALAAALTKAEDETRERIAADIANEIRRKASTLDKMLTEASGIQSELKTLSAAADQFTEADDSRVRLQPGVLKARDSRFCSAPSATC